MRLIGTVLVTITLSMSAVALAQGPIQQAGFGGQGGAISRRLHPYPMSPCPGGNCPEVTYEYIPQDTRGGHLAALGEGARSLWYRLEYLNWTIKAPGDNPLGARRADRNEAGPIFVTTNQFASQPDARAFDLNKNNGIRFSFGAPTDYGDLEMAVWVLDQSDGRIRQDPVRRFDLQGDLDNTVPNFFAATFLMSDGGLSNDVGLFYDQGYQATLKTDVYGAEANFVFNPLTPNQPLTIRPILGFQHINYRENFLIAGADQRTIVDPNDPTAMINTVFRSRIDARSQNNIYAPQIGVRAEFVHEWFTVSVTPKFMLGFNRRQDSLRTAQILALTDGASVEEEATEFSPSFDLKVEARVHVNEHFSLFAGYQLYVLSNISRPIGNINYNTIGGTDSNITLKTNKQHDVLFGGLTVGGELRFH